MLFRILFTTLSIIHITYTTDPPTKTISMKQTPLHVVASQNVKIFCNYTSVEKIESFKILLLKGLEERLDVCSVFWNTTWRKEESKSEFNCHPNFVETEKRVTFQLQNLHINQTDVYTCQIEVIYPPPYEVSESHKGTLIHVEGASEAPTCPRHQRGLEYMLMIAAIGIFIFYSVVVTAACYYCWRKAKKNKIARNDYFNMMPWQSNGVKKKQPHLSVPARNYTAYRSWEP